MTTNGTWLAVGAAAAAGLGLAWYAMRGKKAVPAVPAVTLPGPSAGAVQVGPVAQVGKPDLPPNIAATVATTLLRPPAVASSRTTEEDVKRLQEIGRQQAADALTASVAAGNVTTIKPVPGNTGIVPPPAAAPFGGLVVPLAQTVVQAQQVVNTSSAPVSGGNPLSNILRTVTNAQQVVANTPVSAPKLPIKVSLPIFRANLDAA